MPTRHVPTIRRGFLPALRSEESIHSRRLRRHAEDVCLDSAASPGLGCCQGQSRYEPVEVRVRSTNSWTIAKPAPTAASGLGACRGHGGDRTLVQLFACAVQ